MSRNKSALLWATASVGAMLAARALARQQRRYDFSGRVVLITGGSRGLGLVLARLLAQERARIALTARDADELQRAKSDLAAYTDDVFTMPCDVTSRDQVDELIAAVRQRFGRIDVVINNAGVIEVGPMETMTEADYQEAMQTHFWAPLHVIQAVAPDMQARHSGRIVNIASIGGKISVPHLLPYSASKHALVGLSEGMRMELMKDGVYVTTVCPGLMRTGSHARAQFKGKHRQEYTLFSIIDSLPFSSIDAEAAARQILNACRYGDPELVISLLARVATTFHGLFPGLTADLFGLCCRLLPGPGGIGSARAPGIASRTALSPSPLTALADGASARNNELG